MNRLLLASALALSVSGCAGLDNREANGALIGGAGGAVIGGVATHSVGGALVGGAIGAGAGYLVGRHTYKCERVNMFGERYIGTCWR